MFSQLRAESAGPNALGRLDLPQCGLPRRLSLIWTTVLLVVFAPLAVRKYRSIDR